MGSFSNYGMNEPAVVRIARRNGAAIFNSPLDVILRVSDLKLMKRLICCGPALEA